MIYTTQPLTRCMAAALAGVASLVAWPPAGVLADSHAMAPLPRERANPESEPSANSRETSAPEAAAADTAPVETVPVEAAPVEGSAEYASLVLERYASGKGWDTEFVRDGKGNPEALRLFLPSPLKGRPASGKAVPAGVIGTNLPLQPQQYTSRFRRIAFRQGVAGAVPFRFVDVGWNTEGPPGKRKSDIAGPHFDIHFDTTDINIATGNATCSADDGACNPRASEGDIARRLAKRPARCFLPRGSVPVADTAPVRAGLYNLASGPEPADPSAGEQPAIIYGTFDGEIVFLGVSLSLPVLERAADEADAGERLSWPISQPAAYRYAWWPRTVALEYRPDQRVFGLSLEDFSKRKVSENCS